MSYYENRIKALEEKVAEMAKRERIKAIPVEAQLLDSIVRLKAEVNRLIEERCFLNEKLNHFVKQTVQNREQVERLRKAGDDLIISLDKRDDIFDNSDKRNAINAWNAAKEGKPSA